MPRREQRSKRTFGDELRVLLAEKDISLRRFAATLGVPQSYLSRAMSGERPPSLKLLTSTSDALGLPQDYFAEYRTQVVLDAIKANGSLRDRVYDSLRTKERPAMPRRTRPPTGRASG